MSNYYLSFDSIIDIAITKMSPNIEHHLLTDGERWLLKWQFDKAMGSHERALTNLIIASDTFNLRRLFNAYPDHVIAYVGYGHVESYWSRLQAVHKHISGLTE